MSANKKIEITIETDRVLTIRKSGCTRRWCQKCGRTVDVVRAEIVASLPHFRLRDPGGANPWHCFEGPDGTPLVCLDSLLKSI